MQVLSKSLADISTATNRDDIETVIVNLSTRYGLKTAAYFGTCASTDPREEPFLAVTYSSEWIERYKQQRYVEIDPVIQTGLRRLLPLDWAHFGRPEGILKTFFGEAQEFGLGRHGLSIPVHGRHGDRALLSITSDFTQRVWQIEKPRYLRDFQVLATHIHDMVLRIEGQEKPRPRLSPRELECLQWVATGKTAWECSVILGLSHHTVRCYLESARHKLNASSNTHAVSIAHARGLFFPAF